MADATASTMTWLAQHVAVARRTVEGVPGQIEVALPVWARFDHRTNRDGQPQWHHHVLLPNRVLCSDGRWRTLDGREVYDAAAAMGALWQAHLRAGLTQRLGVSWTEVTRHGQAEIAGVPEDLLAAWSRRKVPAGRAHAEIIRLNEQRAQRGIAPLSPAGRAQIMERAVVISRASKTDVREAAAQRGLATGMTEEEWWRAEAEARGWTPERLIEGVQRAAVENQREAIESTIDPSKIATAAIRRAGAERATFNRRHVEREIAALLPTDLDPDHVAGLVHECTDLALAPESAQAIQVTWATRSRIPSEHRDVAQATGRRATVWYASRDGLRTEYLIVDRAVAMQGTGRGLVSDQAIFSALDSVEASLGHPLDDQQTLAAIRLLTSGDGVQVVEAAAGTGKTTTLAPAAQAWGQEGYRVLGVAPTAQAAHVLGEALPAVHTATLDRALLDWAPTVGGPPAREDWRLDGRTVVIVDEAGMTNRARMDAVTRAIDASGAKLVLVGDASQLGAVRAPGGMFESLAEHLGAERITEVHRFKDGWESDASLRMRDGDASVLPEYQAHGRIRGAESREDALHDVYDRWDAARQDGRDAIMIATRNEDVDVLNGFAREHEQARGRVAREGVVIGGREIARGDVLLLKANDGRIRVGAPSQRQMSGVDARIAHLAARVGTLQRRTERAWQVANRLAPARGSRPSAARVAAWRAARMEARGLRRATTRTIRRLERARADRVEMEAMWREAPAVRNGMRVRVERVTEAGQVTAREIGPEGALGALGGRVVLPRTYVAHNVRRGWADTVHSRQGSTVEHCEVLADASMTREALYVAMTRGSRTNSVTVVAEDGRSPVEVLAGVMARDGRDRTAASRMREVAAREEHLASITQRREQIEQIITTRSPGVPDPVALEAARAERTRYAGEAERLAAAGRDAVRERERHAEAAARVARLEAAAAQRADWEAANPYLVLARDALREREAAREALVAERALREPSVEIQADLGSPRPAEGASRDAWDRAAGLAAIYRERWAAGGETAAAETRRMAEQRAAEAARAAWTAVRDGLGRGVAAVRGGLGR